MASESSTPGLLGWLIKEARNEEEDEPWDQGLSYILIPTTSSHKTVQSLDIQSTSGKIFILAVMLDDGNPSCLPRTIFNGISSRIILPDPTISNLHIRIYSIRYEPAVEPFVYAENCSVNGLDWLYPSNRSWYHRIPRGEAVLLSSGDQLRLCDKTLITFETRIPASQLLTFTQVQEQGDPDCRQVLEKAVRAPRDPLQLLSNNFFPGF
ncbi:MAG: hypothetical protein Q9198_001980 [Flavoplaca austrocitrina]